MEKRYWLVIIAVVLAIIGYYFMFVVEPPMFMARAAPGFDFPGDNFDDERDFEDELIGVETECWETGPEVETCCTWAASPDGRRSYLVNCKEKHKAPVFPW